MAFPPNYRQERNSRDRAKQQKAAEKLAKKQAERADKPGERDPEPDNPSLESSDNKDHS